MKQRRQLLRNQSDRKLPNMSLKIFFYVFTAVVQGDTPEDIYVKVKEVIGEQSGPNIWVPCRDQQL